MEMSQGNGLLANLNKKYHFFLIYKIREQEGRTSHVWRDWYQREGKGVGKG
jgi:hypothetical protein